MNDTVDPNDGLCSFREAVIAANTDTASGPAAGECNSGFVLDLIQFDVSGTIFLTGGEILFQANVTVDGTDATGAGTITVDGSATSRIFRIAGGPITLTDMTITNGSATQGGGIEVTVGTLDLQRVNVRNNTATSTGGGIHNEGSLTINESTVADNTSGDNGGGIHTNATATIERSTISGNDAGSRGGGIYHAGGTSTVRLSTVAENTAALAGGGIRNLDNVVNIEWSTISANEAPSGSGVASFADSVTFTNVSASIISDNTGTGGDVDTGGATNSFVTGGYNVVGDGDATGGFTGTGDTTGVASGLAPLDDNGGPTLTMAPLAGSPAIDRVAGTPTAGSVADDQRDVNRTGTHDSGSIESKCSTSMTAFTQLDLDVAIACYNDTTSGTRTILTTNFTTATPLVQINNPTTADVTIKALGGPISIGALVDGNGFEILDGEVEFEELELTRVASPQAAEGSGISVFSGAVVTLTEAEIYGFIADSTGGGVLSGGDLTLVDSVVRNNGSADGGGGILSTGTLTISGSTIRNNSSFIGGGLVIDGNATVVNTTISGNSATGRGGGIAADGILDLDFSTITDNTSPEGAGVHSADSAGTTTTVGASIVSANNGPDVDVFATNTFVSRGYNVVGSGSGIGAFNQTADATLITDPGLDGLASNGGPTPTHALQLTSPALNRVTAALPVDPTVDQRNEPRIALLKDSGAFESQVSCGLVYVDADQTATGDGASWASAFADLQDGIDRAVFCAPTTIEIWVAEGTYTPSSADRTISFEVPPNVRIVGGFAGTENNVGERPTPLTVVTLSGDLSGNDVEDDPSTVTDNSYRVVTMAGSNSGLYELTVSGGNADGTASDDQRGAGVEVPSGVVGAELFNIEVKSNSADVEGAGVNVRGSALITGGQYHSNQALQGAGLRVAAGGDLEVANATVFGNEASAGGGGMQNSGTARVKASLFFSNNASAQGAGINNAGNLTVISTRFEGNIATNQGGGIHVSFGSFTITNSVFIDNTGVGGGGMNIQSGSTGTITNSTFTDNTETGLAGGAIRAVSAGTNVNIRNSIIWANNSGLLVAGDATATVNHSIVQGTGGSGPGWPAVAGTDGGDNLDEDPQFLSPGLGNVSLISGSPAINAGNNVNVPADSFDVDTDFNTTEPTPDLVLTDRIVGGLVDMGAQESDFISTFTPLAGPCAIYDSRTATGTGLSGPFGANQARTLNVTGALSGQGGDTNCVPTTASSVTFTISAIDPQGIGNLRLSPTGASPTGGVVNYQANGLNNTNTVTVPVGPNGLVDVFANANGTHVRLIALGYNSVAGTLSYNPVTPCAVADSRTTGGDPATGAFAGPFAAGAAYPDIDVVGTVPVAQGGNPVGTNCGIPAGAEAIVVNLVAVRPQGASGFAGTGHLAAAASGVNPQEPTTPFGDLTLNNAAATVIPLNGGQTIAVDVEALTGAPSSHIRVVVLGYYDDVTGADFNAVSPCAVFDSRSGTGGFAGKRLGGASTTYDMSSDTAVDQGGTAGCSVPTGVSAVLINLVAIQPEASGNFRAFATGSTPTGGVVNFAPLVPPMNNSNAVVVPVSTAGQIDLFVNAPSVDGDPAVHARGIILGYFD